MLTTEEVYDALQEAGAPLTSREDLDRLYQGRMAELLNFVATNLPGRQTAAVARQVIQTHRERNRSYMASQADVDPLYSRLQRARAAVKNSQVALNQLEAAHDRNKEKIAELEDEQATLQAELESKWTTTLMMQVLERKENIRKIRFSDIMKLLEELREKTNETQTPGVEDVPLFSLDKGVNVPRAEHTIDTLAALQAHSLRLSRISTLAKDEGLQDLTQASEARLLDVVARSRNSSSNDPEVIAMHEKCLKAAKSQARENVHYDSPLPFEEENEGLQYVSERISRKEHNLQDLADHASALTLACARAIQANIAFANLTAPLLGEALQKEAAAAQGHVDALRLSIVNNSPRADPTQGPHNVRTLDRGRSFTQRLVEIKDIFTDTNEAEMFLEHVDRLLSPDTGAVQSNSAAAVAYVNFEEEVSGRIHKLLERKAAKANAGRVLIEDIERLVAEVGIIAGSS